VKLKQQKLTNLKFLNTFITKNQNALKLKTLSKRNRIYLKTKPNTSLTAVNTSKTYLTLYLFSILHGNNLKSNLKIKSPALLINHLNANFNCFFENN
jgi:hypothetical protein